MSEARTCGRVLAACLLLFSVGVTPAAAGSIGFEIKATVAASTERVELELDIRNTGDETAFSLKAETIAIKFLTVRYCCQS